MNQRKVLKKFTKAYLRRDVNSILEWVKDYTNVGEAEVLQPHERRVFKWMQCSSLLGDIALNILCYWMLEMREHKTSS